VANLTKSLYSRSVAVTAAVLKEYKDLITNTTTDLEDHLKEIDDKLQALSSKGSSLSSEDIVERERVQEEKDSTKQCLTICAQVSEHISQVQPLAVDDISAVSRVIVGRVRGLSSARQATASALNECKEKLTSTASDLERHLHEMENRLRILPSQGPTLSGEDATERERIQEEKESIKQCLSICAEASQQVKDPRTNIFGDVSAGEDSHQVIVATLGDLISARQVTAGNRGTQWLGQMSDESLQQLSKARIIQKPGSAAKEGKIEPGSAIVTKFEGNYGAGYKLE
jgi:predicted  nucleic acid-binding Zn-ribbon protein